MNHPLLCWDIVLEGLGRRFQLSNDLKALKKIMYNNDSRLPVTPDSQLIWENKVILITDSWLNIIYATENIYAMNGYHQYEVIGKTPKIFQGAETEVEERKKIKTSIDNRRAFKSIITNYKKNGSTYKCHIEGYPLFNQQGELVNFIALERAA